MIRYFQTTAVRRFTATLIVPRYLEQRGWRGGEDINKNLDYNDPNVIYPLYFPFFSLIYKNSSFLFISYFDGDGRGGDGELRIKRPWPKLFCFVHIAIICVSDFVFIE